MTAIQTRTASPTTAAAAGDGSKHARPRPSASLAAAQLRFTQAVTRGILELERRCGYSRERATAALLRAMRRGDAPVAAAGPPNDQEVFRMMKLYGLGMDDASQALTVSKAVTRVMSERGLSAVEAIDDLSLKLSVSNLLETPDNLEETKAPASTSVDHARSNVVTTTTTTAAPGKTAVTVPTSVSTSQRKSLAGTKKPHPKPIQKSHGGNNTKGKSSKGCSSSKHGTRKRPSPSTDETSKSESMTRTRADSVTEEVNAKVAKKARMSQDESTSLESSTSTGATVRAPPPSMVRAKRSASLMTQEEAVSNPADM